MTASTPPLVDVIAGVLRGHIPGDTIGQYAPDGVFEGEILCSCGHVTKYAGELDLDDKAHAAHQARAVLDSLTKAGGVEWGWEYQSIIGGAYDKRITRNWGADRPLTREEAQAHVEAMNKNTKRSDVARLVTRVTGTWEPC